MLWRLKPALLAAAAAGLISWHASRSELLGPGLPRWVAPAIVTAAAIGIPILATQTVLFAEPLFGVLLAIAAGLATSLWTLHVAQSRYRNRFLDVFPDALDLDDTPKMLNTLLQVRLKITRGSETSVFIRW